MTGLPWTEENIADELAGALLAAASYCAFKPGRAEAVREAVLDRLGEGEKDLIYQLRLGISTRDRLEMAERTRPEAER